MVLFDGGGCDDLFGRCGLEGRYDRLPIARISPNQ
jgi:hypothetical protein